MITSTAETKYFHLHKLSEGVYAAIAKPGTGAWSNAGFVDLGEELLVFDAFSTPAAARQLRIEAERITGKKVRFLINSHYHGDHVFGNQEFLDASIISTTLTRSWSQEQNIIGDIEKEQEEMRQYLHNLKEQLEKTSDTVLKNSIGNQYDEMAKVLEAVPELKTVLPSITFESKMVIHGTKRVVELFCIGGGHSPSDTFMFLPQEKIAFMADLITENLHVPIYNPEEFRAILSRVKGMNIESVVPGHGSIGTIKYFDILTGYLTLLIDQAKEAHQNHVSLKDFLDSFSIPSSYANWKGPNGINRNLTSVYNFYLKEKEHANSNIDVE